MKKQEENGLAKVLTENGLSEIMQTKITQQEVVEMMLVEKRKKMDVEIQKLKDNISTLDVKIKKENDVLSKKMEADFDKEIDKIFVSIKKMYPSAKIDINKERSSLFDLRININTNTNTYKFPITQSIVDKHKKGSKWETLKSERKQLNDELSTLTSQKDKLNYQMPEVKAAITRKLLNTTKEGMDILKNMEEIFKNI